MKRSRLIITISAIAFFAIGFFAWETAEIRQFAGEYVAVDAHDSAYELNLSRTGQISVVDIGAGNPALEGYIFRNPFAAGSGRYYLRSSGETDDAFLDLGENKGKASVWLSSLGQTDADDEPAVLRVITIETGTDHMQFNEKGFE